MAEIAAIWGSGVRIEHCNRHGCVVLTLVGRLDLAAAPEVQRALLKHLGQQPPAIICDLAGVEAIDPVCAGVFSSLRHPALGWPGTVVAVCGARPAVAAVLTRHRAPWLRSLYGTLDEAITHARARPLRRRERLALGPVPTAAGAARAFVRRVCARWGLDALAGPAALLANELVTNAVVHARTRLELRVELRGSRLQVAVRDRDPRLVGLLAAKDAGDCGLGLVIVNRVAKAWGVRQDPAGGKVVWCILDRSVPLPELSSRERDPSTVWQASAGMPAGRTIPNGWQRQLPAMELRHSACAGTGWGAVGLPDVRNRDWLAGGLLELVIRPLLGIGLQLQTIIGLAQDAEVSRRLEAAAADVDDLINDVRAGVFDPDGRQAPRTADPLPRASWAGVR